MHQLAIKKTLITLSEIFVDVRRIEWDMIKKIHVGLYVTCLLFLSDFNEI